MTDSSITALTANPKEEALAAELAALQEDGVALHPALTPRLILVLEEAGFVVDLITAEVIGRDGDQVTPTPQALDLFANLQGAALVA